MPSPFEATHDYFKAEVRVETLLKFAEQEGVTGHDDNRNLFLKLGVVLLVTQFQVFVERILEEYDFEIKKLDLRNKQLPWYLRLEVLKSQIEKSKIYKAIQHPNDYTESKVSDIRLILEGLHRLCDDDAIVPDSLQIKKKYPLGKQGLNELKDLFKQIEGKDIFEHAIFDINKLNEILNRRHSIVHEDSNSQLTEVTLTSYKEFIASVVTHINLYLQRHVTELMP
jgi:hypothetical protein